MTHDQPGRLPARLPVALALALLVGTFPQFALGALAPQLRDTLDLSPADLGLVFAGLYAAGVFGSPLAGAAVDRIGGRRACIGLLLVGALSLLAAAAAPGRSGLLLAMVPAGAAMAFANPGTNRWASAAPTARQQGTLVGIAQAGVQAGALLAGALAAASALGLDWRGALRVGALLGLLGAVLAWWSPADPAGATARGRAVAPVGEVVRAVRRLAAYALLMGAGTSVVLAYLPSYAVDRAGFTNAAAGTTVVVYGGVALACRLGLGALLRRTGDVGPGLLVAMSVGAAAAIGIIAAAATAPAWLWGGAVVFGATGTTWPAVAYLAVVRVSPPGGAGRAAGWMTAAFYVGLWVGPPLAGQVIVARGYGWVWVGAVACYLAALVPAMGVRRPAAPRDAADGRGPGALKPPASGPPRSPGR